MSDWSSDVCSSDLAAAAAARADGYPRAASGPRGPARGLHPHEGAVRCAGRAASAGRHTVDGHERGHRAGGGRGRDDGTGGDGPVRGEEPGIWNRDSGIVRSEEHTSELQSLMRISYAVFCLKKTKTEK